MVIDAKPKATIIFRDEQNWGIIGRIQWSDETVDEHILNLLFGFLKLERAHLVESLVNRGHPVFQINFAQVPLEH